MCSSGVSKSTRHVLLLDVSCSFLGTVLQNKYKELWCIFHWAAENSLGSKKSFQEYYEHPLKLGQRIHAPHSLIQLARERQVNSLSSFILSRIVSLPSECT